MTQNMQVRHFVLHHAMSEVNLFGLPYRIHLAAHSTDLARILAAIRIGVGEID